MIVDDTRPPTHDALCCRCPECDNLLRPGVVLFGEGLDMEKIGLLESEMRKSFDAIFSVGTTSVFPYIAQPVVMGARRGAFTVEVNPGRTPVKLLLLLFTSPAANWPRTRAASSRSMQCIHLLHAKTP